MLCLHLEEQNAEVMRVIGSITKILRTLQLAIFLSSLLRYFFSAELSIFFHFPELGVFA